MGFTPEQLEILDAAFDHLWARFARLHDDLNDDTVKVAALLTLLVDKHVATGPDFFRLEKKLRAETGAAVAVNDALRGDARALEQQLTRRILRGDTQAFVRQRADEREQEQVENEGESR
jgi:hypothetical protein